VRFLHVLKTVPEKCAHRHTQARTRRESAERERKERGKREEREERDRCDTETDRQAGRERDRQAGRQREIDAPVHHMRTHMHNSLGPAISSIVDKCTHRPPKIAVYTPPMV